jgi:hypothetical protein
MEIHGSIKGEISIKRVSFYPSENSRIAIAVLATRFSPEEARAALGEIGEKTMFSGWHENGEEHHALFKRLTPDVIFEEHIVELMDWKGRVTPILGAVKPVEGESKVDVHIELPLPVVESMKAFYGRLCCSVGGTEKVKFQLAQPTLPNVAAGNGAPRVIKKPGPHGSQVATTVGG